MRATDRTPPRIVIGLWLVLAFFEIIAGLGG
ncbi:hypothetical protein NBRC3299_0257 [Acetobacter pasteurianus NBRC 3299]|nr:hypothetical protein NBRC3299_0257 [Acetobacter pasteurianus NBRC 3299]